MGNRFRDLWHERRTQAVVGLVAVLAGLIRLLPQVFLTTVPCWVRWVTTGFLGSAILAFAGTIAWPLLRRNRTPSSPYEQVYERLAEAYGYGCDNLEIECIIREDGSARIVQTIEVKAFSFVDWLDAFLRVPEKAPDGDAARAVFHRSVTSLNSERHVTPVIVKDGTDGELISGLRISPALNAGETFGYKLEQDISSGVYAVELGQEELERREKEYDYFSWNISRPTRKLSLRVFFPVGTKSDAFHPEVFHYVLPGQPSRLDRSEFQRIDGPHLEGPDGERFSLRLEVDYPKLNRLYHIQWQPLVAQ